MNVKPDSEVTFEKAWSELTVFIRDFEGGLGSRLHRENDGVYIAYAQWPSKERWQASGDNLPNEVQPIRASLRESCSSVETLHELEMIDDLLVPFSEIS